MTLDELKARMPLDLNDLSEDVSEDAQALAGELEAVPPVVVHDEDCGRPLSFTHTDAERGVRLVRERVYVHHPGDPDYPRKAWACASFPARIEEAV